MKTPAQPRTGSRIRAALRCSVLTLAALLAGVPAAHAEFTSAPMPSTSIRSLAVLDQGAWAAIASNAPNQDSVHVTTNRGATWTTVTGLLNPGDSMTSLTAAPSQTYRAVVFTYERPSGFQVKSITRTGVVTNVGPLVQQFALSGASAVDDAGTIYVPYLNVFSPDLWGVVRVTAAGEVTVFPGPRGPVVSAVSALRAPDGIRIRTTGSGAYRVEGTALIADGAEPVLLRDGQLLIGSGAASFDGGAHWLQGAGSGVVAGAPGQPAVTNLKIGNRIGTRFDVRMFRAAPPRIPFLFSSVVSTGAGFVAWSAGGIAVYDGALPASWPASIGPVQPDTVAMLERANGLRADAGLPPLVPEAAMSQAARNHANYDKQWNEGHSETPGRAGFTGEGPGQRCAAAGTACNGEVMHYVDGPYAVDGWVATPFHRPTIVDPRPGIVGAAQSAGPESTSVTSVIDSGEDLQKLVAPVGYPQGNYRGPVAFSGESPDPAQMCASSNQPVTYPLGAAVTLFAPGRAQMVGVREVGGAPLAGCLLGDVFVPEDPFVVGRTYEATGNWDIGEATLRPHTWTFTAKPDLLLRGGGLGTGGVFTLPGPTAQSGPDTTKPLLSSLSSSPSRFRAAATGASIAARGRSRVSYALSEPATVSFKVQRATTGRRVGGRCVTSKRSNRSKKRCTRYSTLNGTFTHQGKPGRNALRFSGRIANRKLTPGRYQLRAVATDAARNASLPKRTRFQIVRR